MTGIRLMAFAALAGLAACTEAPTGGAGGAQGAAFAALPPNVAEIAAPYQNLQATRLDPTDGCYWYRYDGPVESTWLPLRTKNGNPICTRES